MRRKCASCGPFRGLTAVLDAAYRRVSACVLRQLLSRDTLVELPARWVRQA
jgi:hypothetical protein